MREERLAARVDGCARRWPALLPRRVATTHCGDACRTPERYPVERAAGAINSSVAATARRERANGPGRLARRERASLRAPRSGARLLGRATGVGGCSRQSALFARSAALRQAVRRAGAPRSGAPLRRAHVAHAGGLPATRRAATARGVALRPISRAARGSVVRPALGVGRDAGLAASTGPVIQHLRHLQNSSRLVECRTQGSSRASRSGASPDAQQQDATAAGGGKRASSGSVEGGMIGTGQRRRHDRRSVEGVGRRAAEVAAEPLLAAPRPGGRAGIRVQGLRTCFEDWGPKPPCA